MAHNLQRIKKTLDSPAGEDLKNFLVERILELKSIEAIDDKKDFKEVAIEVKANKRACDKLVNILKDILTISTSVTKKKSFKDSYNVLP